MSRYLRPFLMLMGAAVVGGVVAAFIFSGQSSHTTTVVRERVVDPAALTTVHASGLTPAQIYRQDAPGVVVVQSVIPGGTNSLGFPQGTETALGSGFVIDGQGHILTNAHVVEGAQKVTVGFSSASGLDNTYPAKVLSRPDALEKPTVTLLAPSTTWALVRMWPCSSITKPEPSAVSAPCGKPRELVPPGMTDCTTTTPGASCR